MPPKRGLVGGKEILSRRVRRELDRHVSDHENVRFCLRGCSEHALIALDERLLIVKPGFHAGTTFGALCTTFYYQDVTGIQLHTLLMAGWIEVSTPSFQGRERKRNRHPRSSDRDVYKLPSCVPISKRHVDEYRSVLGDLRERIELSKRYGRVVGDAPPLVSSLERIANLHRIGALSEFEFQELKQLLLRKMADEPLSEVGLNAKASKS
jgi:hypothetical protein